MTPEKNTHVDTPRKIFLAFSGRRNYNQAKVAAQDSRAGWRARFGRRREDDAMKGSMGRKTPRGSGPGAVARRRRVRRFSRREPVVGANRQPTADSAPEQATMSRPGQRPLRAKD